MKETGILIDKPKLEKPKTVRTPENIAAVGRKCVRSAININSPSFSTTEHFGDIIDMNFALRPWYDATQSSIGSGVEAN